MSDLARVLTRDGFVREKNTAVVLEFLNRLEDIGQCAVSTVLDRSFLESPTVPALCEFLNRRYVNQSVVQVINDLRHIRFEEELIRTNGVTGQECFIRRVDAQWSNPSREPDSRKEES